MNKLFSYFIDNSFKVHILSLFAVILGIWSLQKVNVNFLPETEQPHLFFSISHPDFSVFEMEKEFTLPLVERIQHLKGVKGVSSSVRKSYTDIYIDLTDIGLKSEVLSKIDEMMPQYISKLPSGREDISFDIPWDKFELAQLAVAGLDYNNEGHRAWLKYVLARIAQIEGVSFIERDLDYKNVFIDLSSEKLEKNGLNSNDVRGILNDYLKPQTLGYIRSNAQKIEVGFPQTAKDIHDLEQIIILNKDGKKIHLRDLAQVEHKVDESRRYSEFKGKPFRMYQIEGASHINVLTVINRIKNKVHALAKDAPSGVDLDLLFETDGFIRKQINLLIQNALIGGSLVALILGLFIGFRVSLMVLWGIPVVYGMSLFALYYFNIQIDLISVTALIIVIGILVDDAVIVSEKYTDLIEKGETSKDAALQTIHKTIFPLSGAMLTTIIAFYPIAYNTDGTRGWFWGIFIIILITLSASWLESYFILPNHLVHFVKNVKQGRRSKLFKKVKEAYQKALRGVLKIRYLILPLLLIFTYLTYEYTYKGKSISFNLSINYPQTNLLIDFDKAYSFQESSMFLQPVKKILDEYRMEGRIGEYFIRLGTKRIKRVSYEGKEYGSIRIVIAPEVDNPKEKLLLAKEGLKNVFKQIKLPGIQRIEFQDDINGSDEIENSIELRVEGSDQHSLETLISRIDQTFSSVEGVEQVDLPSDLFESSWKFYPYYEKLKEYGLSLDDIKNELRPNLFFSRLQKIRFQGEESTVYLGVDNPLENDMSKKDMYFVTSKNDLRIPLTELGTWKKEKAVKNIRHYNAQRLWDINIQFDPKQRHRKEIGDDLKIKIDSLKKEFPGYTFDLRVESENRKNQKNWLFESSFLALLGIYFILVMSLKSLFKPFFVMIAIPFGVMGVSWAIYLHGLDWTMVGLIGIIGMAGVVVNDSLLMMDAVNEYSEQTESLKDAILKGASERLRPIVITTVTTLAGVFPLAYGVGGDADYTRMLVFSLGWGILSSTLMVLFVLPGILGIYADLKLGQNLILNKLKSLKFR